VLTTQGRWQAANREILTASEIDDWIHIRSSVVWHEINMERAVERGDELAWLEHMQLYNTACGALAAFVKRINRRAKR